MLPSTQRSYTSGRDLVNPGQHSGPGPVPTTPVRGLSTSSAQNLYWSMLSSVKVMGSPTWTTLSLIWSVFNLPASRVPVPDFG